MKLRGGVSQMMKNRDAGKGSYPRQEYTKKDKERYDRIFGKVKRGTKTDSDDGLQEDTKEILPKDR